MYPGNSIFVSVGGTELRVWDMLAGGRLLARPDDFSVVAGMANGLISMQHRQTPAEARALNPKQTLKEQKESQTAYRFRLNADFRNVNRTFNPATDIEIATKNDNNFVSRYDMFLRKFQYSKALDTVLS
uniref:Uncharacterized protein n=1 Tax=Daphnia galeata TaxID=27404 RepID=A0A8J2WHE3_9CRUS|nr:unnamed protein product [Daphnia galeata]